MDKLEQLGMVEALSTILPVDNPNITTDIVKGKQKILTMNVDEEWIENSLLDLPFIYLSLIHI